MRKKSKELMERMAATVGGAGAAGLASSFGFAPLAGSAQVSAAEERKVDGSGLADTHSRANARLARVGSTPHLHPHPHPHPRPHPHPHPHPLPAR